jgi:hypothetical protein
MYAEDNVTRDDWGSRGVFGVVQEEFFTTEFHGNRKKALRQGALMDKCNWFRRAINSTAYRKCRLGLSSRARRGGKRCCRIKTPWYANRRFDMTSVVNSYFLDSPRFCYFRSIAKTLIVCSLLIFLSCRSLSPVDGRAERLVSAALPETVLPQWRPVPVPDSAENVDGIADSIAYYAGKVSHPRIEFNALRIDLSSPNLRILAAGGGGTAGGSLENGKFISTKVSSFVRDNGLMAGINALPFDPVSDREGEPRTNIGIVIADGVMISPPHPRFDALFFYADGKAVIAAQSAIFIENITNAVGGFHRILETGELVSRVHGITARHPRSAAGISSDGRFLYLLVIDGRRLDSIGSTEAETALLLRALGASEGINFDGGGSSALALRYPDGTVRVVNTPVHGNIQGKERAVAGCLGLGLVKK